MWARERWKRSFVQRKAMGKVLQAGGVDVGSFYHDLRSRRTVNQADWKFSDDQLVAVRK